MGQCLEARRPEPREVLTSTVRACSEPSRLYVHNLIRASLGRPLPSC